MRHNNKLTRGSIINTHPYKTADHGQIAYPYSANIIYLQQKPQGLIPCLQRTTRIQWKWGCHRIGRELSEFLHEVQKTLIHKAALE